MNPEIASLLAVLAVAAVLIAVNATLNWLADQYEITRFRVTRRWYGTRAHLTRRGCEDDQAPALYVVLCRDTENLPVPWLKVCQLDATHITRWYEEGVPFWAPVTEFAPYTVHKFRPGVLRYGRLPVPWFSWWLPLRRPAGYLEAGA